MHDFSAEFILLRFMHETLIFRSRDFFEPSASSEDLKLKINKNEGFHSFRYLKGSWIVRGKAIFHKSENDLPSHDFRKFLNFLKGLHPAFSRKTRKSAKNTWGFPVSKFTYFFVY